MTRQFKLSLIAAAVMMAAHTGYIHASCQLTNLPPSSASYDGTYSLTINNGQCDLYDYAYQITDPATGAGSAPSNGSTDYQQVAGWQFGYLQNGQVGLTLHNLGEYGEVVADLHSLAVEPEVGGTNTQGDPSLAGDYQIFMTRRGNGFGVKLENGAKLISTGSGGNLFIESAVTRHHSLMVNSGAEAQISGNLLVKNTTGSAAGAVYYNRTIYSSGGITRVAKDLYSLHLENPVTRNNGHSANLELAGGGEFNVAGNGHIYSKFGGTGIRTSDSTLEFGGNLDVINARVRNRPANNDTNLYTSFGINSTNSTISAGLVRVLTQGFGGIVQAGDQASLQADALLIDTRLRDADDRDNWTNNARGLVIAGGKGLAQEAVINAVNHAVHLTGANSAFSLGDSAYASLADLSLKPALAFLSLGEKSVLRADKADVLAIADGVDSEIHIKAGAVIEAQPDFYLVHDGSGEAMLKLDEGANLTGDIFLGAGKDTVEVRGDLKGNLLLGEDDDVANLYSGDFSLINHLDAGAGSADTLNLYGALSAASVYAASDPKSAALLNFNQINIHSGGSFNLQGESLDADSLYIASGGELTLAQAKRVGTVNANLINQGLINLDVEFRDVGQRLVVNGDYEGRNGVLELNTEWFEQEPAERDGNHGYSISDELLINGNASGRTQVKVRNGIFGDVTLQDFHQHSVAQVIVKGAVSADAFWGYADTTNAGEAQLVYNNAGKFRWQLDVLAEEPGEGGGEEPGEGGGEEPGEGGGEGPGEGGEGPGEGGGEGPGEGGEGPGEGGEGPGEGGGEGPGEGGEGPGEGGEGPGEGGGGGPEIYSPDVPGYVLAPNINLELLRDSVGHFRERKGGQYNFSEQADKASWGRVWHRDLDADGNKRLDYNTSSSGFQVGQELANTQDGQDSARTDFYFSYVKGTSKTYDQLSAEGGHIIDNKRAGSIDTQALSLGLTRTYIGADNDYKDLVLQVSRLKNDYEGRRGRDATNRGWAVTGSFEQGARVDLKDNLYLEPMYQLMVNYLDLDDFDDGVRQVKQTKEWDGLLRAGTRLYHERATGHEQNHLFFAKAYLNRDLADNGRAEIGRSKVSEKNAKQWLEIGVGVELQPTKNTYVFMEAGMERHLGGPDRDAWAGQISINHKW